MNHATIKQSACHVAYIQTAQRDYRIDYRGALAPPFVLPSDGRRPAFFIFILYDFDAANVPRLIRDTNFKLPAGKQSGVVDSYLARFALWTAL